MIVNDQSIAQHVAASALTLALFLTATGGVNAAETALQQARETASAAQAPAGTVEAAPEPGPAVSVSLVHDGQTSTLTTHAGTVAAFLAERGLHAAPSDFLSVDLASAPSDGATIVLRSAVPVSIEIGPEKRQVDSAAETVGDLLAEQHVALRASDEVRPAAGERLTPYAVVRVLRIDTWTSHARARILPAVKQRVDAKLMLGKTRTIDAGAPGVCELTLRFIKRGNATPKRVVLASRIVRPPRARVIVRGIATYDSLAHLAQLGFASAIGFASSALRVLATAYTAGCLGCSGITASGARAGFGIIAVDPSIIPLGTRLFIPGYGRAVAGDTGGAILGRRVDLGFNSDGEAMRWGRRPVTVYILK